MSALIKTSEAASLAFHAMSLLAAAGDRLLTRCQIAHLLRCSEAHLTKVLQRLNKVGLVKSVRGPTGGFALNRPAQSISLLEIYEALEGQLAPLNCLLNRQVCGGTRCVLGGLLGELNSKTSQYLAGTTLQDVANTHGVSMIIEGLGETDA